MASASPAKKVLTMLSPLRLLWICVCESLRLTTLEILQVLVPIANGTEPMEAVIAVDVLRRAGADVTVASVEQQLRIEACHGVKIIADALVSDCGQSAFDLIALPVSHSLLCF